MTDQEKVLNDWEYMYQADTKGMFQSLATLAGQCTTACWDLPRNIDLPAVEAISNVVVTGLGGSAIGGDLLRIYCLDKCLVPVVVNRNYVMPEFVGRDTLVFAVSYSGNTEETISSYLDAKKRGATIIAITTGGKLKEMADGDGATVIPVPGGISPRSASGFLFIPTLRIMEKLGFLSGIAEEVEKLVDHLKKLHENLKPEIPVEKNSAKQMAMKLYNRIPIIWGSSGTTEVVAQRWKGQINENAKSPAYWNVFPELNHNELVGFKFPESLLKQLHIVILRDDQDHPRVQKRIEISKNVISKSVAGITDVRASGGGLLARTYSLIYSGDYTSVYLAFLYGVDPGPVEVIDYLKDELAKN
ncbi:MAG: bifunctional phosphoglucose/phosphomannose isomerase [Actinobacteria bacterium]|nr:bifunctional phosphoglucose/phosphomannose isomerase [Actinomycetota bacterium]